MTLLTLAGAEARESRAKALVFDDPLSQDLLRRLRQLAPSDATILVAGETGTGKEIVARHIHDLSRRAAMPFVPVNCGALTETLVESELFGHARGAFTGATSAQDGWFEAAQGGTLFLDEIGELPVAAQVKLLRVLQEREVVRVGSRRAIPLDVRVVAATNVDLKQAVAAGRFREDLFYRLGVATLHVPPLRERPGDIPRLVEHFLGLYRRRMGVGAAELTPDAIDALLAHRWPGNVRELENVVQHALIVSQGGRIVSRDLGLASQVSLAEPRERAPDTSGLERALVALFESQAPALHARVEETLFRAAHRYCEGNQLETARLLGISRNVVRARFAAHGLLPARRDPAAKEPAAGTGAGGGRPPP